jgi:endonuclease III
MVYLPTWDSGVWVAGAKALKKMKNYFPHVEKICRALYIKFGRNNLGNYSNPLDELFYILLSSKTPPSRYQAIYQKFKSAYPDFNKLVNANWKRIARVIKDAGLQNRKAKAINSIAKRVYNDFGAMSLDALKSMNNNEIEQYLVSLPEISVKSARCVMMYSLKRKVFPVDNHCFRVCTRLGWVDKNISLTKKTADKIQNGIPPNLRRKLHIGMVLLGRDFCTPSNPDCHSCPILKYCPTGISRTK